MAAPYFDPPDKTQSVVSQQLSRDDAWLDRLQIRGPQHRRLADLITLGARPRDIGKQLGMRPRTVKAHLGKLFTQFGIQGGTKIVKLSVLLYRAKHGKER